MLAQTFELPFPLQLGLTLGHLRRGRYDPTMRIGRDELWRTTRTPQGAATMQLRLEDDTLQARVWGPGAPAALAAVPALIGWHDRPNDLQTKHPVVRALRRAARGLRIGRTGAVLEALIPAVLEQKVTSYEGHAAYAALVRRFGEPAPGPADLLVSPQPERIAASPYYAFHRLAIERRRADVLREICLLAARVEALAELPAEEAKRRMMTIPGIGPWTAAEVSLRALGDADAVPVGDYHLSHLVAWTFEGQRRGDDEHMLELLEPFRGQRARVIRMIETTVARPARRTPRARLRQIASI